MVNEGPAAENPESLREILGLAEEVNLYADPDADPRMGVAFTEVFKDSLQAAEASAADALAIFDGYLAMGRPFGLFLRAFEGEAYRYDVPMGKDFEPGGMLFRTRGPQSVERHLHSSVHPHIPFIAILNQADVLAEGLIPRYPASNDDWESVVKTLVQEAAIIVFHCYALGPGVTAELDLLRDGQREDSTVIVLKDAEPPKRSLPVDLFRGYTDTHHETPRKDHPDLAGFPRVAYEREIDWDQLEISPFFGDLLQAALRHETDPTRLPDLTEVPLDRRVTALAERSRGLRHLGRLEEAAAVAADAVAFAEQSGHRQNMAATQGLLGIAAFKLGRLDVAQKAFHQSGELYHDLGNKAEEATVASWLAYIYKKAGLAEQAVLFFLINLDLARNLNAADVLDSLREMAPLLDQISPATRQKPGVRFAAELIEKFHLNQSPSAG